MPENREVNRKLLNEMIQCVKREVSLRYAVYPKLIASGKMTEKTAENEKRLMYAVQRCLQKIYDGTAPIQVQQTLFNSEFYKSPTVNSFNAQTL